MALDPYGINDEIDPYVAWASQPAPGVPEPVPVAPMIVPIEQPPAPVPDTAPVEAFPLEVDAVSAAAPAPTVGDVLANQADVSTEPYAAPVETPASYLAHFQTPEVADAYLEQQRQGLGEQPLPSMRETEAANQAAEHERIVNAMSPEQFLDYKNKHESAMLLKQAELEHQAIAENERRARESLEVQRAATEKADADTKQVLADAQRVANTKVNPDRYMQNRGIGGTIRDVASTILMGLGGDAQMGLNMLNQRIDRDIAAQKDDIANQWAGIKTRGGAIADEYARHGDLYRASETYRIAAYQGAINDIQSQMQLYDPAGSTAIRGRDALDQLHAAQLKSERDINQKLFDDYLKLGEFRLKERDQLLKEQQRLDKLSKVGAKPTKLEDIPLTREQLQVMFPGAAIPEGMPSMTMKQARTFAETGKSFKEFAKSGEDLTKAQRENSPEERLRSSVIPAPPSVVVDEAGNVSLKRGTGNLKQEDGSDWIPSSPDEAKAFRKQKTAADGLIEILDEIRVIRDRTGGESSWGNSDDYQRLKVLKNRATKLAKAGTEGMSSDEDMKKIDAALGASDPASFRAQAAGLEEGRKGVERELDIAARNIGYTGKPIAYPDPVKARKAEKSAEQSTVERVLYFDPNDSKRQEAYAKELGVYGDAFKRGKADERAEILGKAMAVSGGILPSIKQSIDDLRETAANPNAKPKERDLARAAIERIASDAESPVVRDYINRNPEMPAPSPEEVE